MPIVKNSYPYNPNSKQAVKRDITFLHIESDEHYFNTKEQIRRGNINYYTDLSIPSRLTGSTVATGLFSQRRVVKDDSVYNSSVYATGSTVTDPSGTDRKILALNIDYFASSSVDSYRNGVEITEEKHWNAGAVKITAGTPGHLYRSDRYGHSDVSILSEDKYIEVDIFDPVRYVMTGGDPEVFTYPIITSDVNQLENYILNGIIEPFPIRPVISNFSINFPFEPHSVRGEFGSGNQNSTFAGEEILTVDYYLASSSVSIDNASGSRYISGNAPYLDAVDMVSISTGAGTSTVHVGQPIGYFSQDRNRVLPFVDVVYPRNRIPSSSYDSGLISALLKMTGSMKSQEYVSEKQKSAATGFLYDGYQGVDSIAFGGLLF